MYIYACVGAVNYDEGYFLLFFLFYIREVFFLGWRWISIGTENCCAADVDAMRGRCNETSTFTIVCSTAAGIMCAGTTVLREIIRR